MFLNSILEQHKLITKLTNPAIDLMNSLSLPIVQPKQIVDLLSFPVMQHEKMMDALSLPKMQHMLMTDLIDHPIMQHSKIMDVLDFPLKLHEKSLSNSPNFLDTPLEFKLFEEIFVKPHKEFDQLSQIQKAIDDNESLRLLRDLTLELKDDIQINNEGVITLCSEQMTTSELENLTETVFQNQSLSEAASLEEAINGLVEAIESIQDPLKQNIFVTYIYPILLIFLGAVLNPVIDTQIKKLFNADKKIETKRLKEKASSVVDNKKELGTFRYVSADILNVRSSASVKSDIIGYLHFSQVVVVVEKQRNWSLVEWRNPDTRAQVSGWVFTRYLKRFK